MFARKLAAAAGVLLALSSAAPSGAHPLHGEVFEKSVSLDTSRRLAEVLRAQGFRPVLVRSADVGVPLARRVEIANRAAPRLFVSVHANSFRDPAKRGSTVIFQGGKVPSERAARAILKGLAARAGTVPRGAYSVKGRSGRDLHYVLRNTVPTSVLVEIGALSHREEARNLAWPVYRAKLAQGIADGIAAVATKGQTVVIDPGHGGRDVGAVGKF